MTAEKSVRLGPKKFFSNYKFVYTADTITTKTDSVHGGFSILFIQFSINLIKKQQILNIVIPKSAFLILKVRKISKLGNWCYIPTLHILPILIIYMILEFK